jgi:hypothetical protein
MLQLELFKGLKMKVYLFVILSFLLSSCTLSFQNISTHGTATDLVDENQSPQNDISPTITAPMGAL